MTTPPPAGSRRVRVPSTAAGRRLDLFLTEKFPRWSRKKLARVVKAGDVLVDGRPGRPGTVLAGGETLTVPPMGEAVDREATAAHQRKVLARPPNEVRIVHEDEDLLVVEKPPGMPVHGGAELGAVRTMLEALKERVLAGFGLVHRLDKDTSGLVALVRGEEARAATARRFAEPEGGVRKVYEAIVQGTPVPAEGRIDLPLSPPGHGGRARVDQREGKPALTLYETVETFEGVSRLRLELKTGRTHQIRAHLAAIGHPLLVDPTYLRRGGWRLADPRGLHDARLTRTPLHAAELTIPHPRTGEPLTFRSPLPPDMKYALEVLRVIAGRRRKAGGAPETPGSPEA